MDLSRIPYCIFCWHFDHIWTIRDLYNLCCTNQCICYQCALNQTLFIPALKCNQCKQYLGDSCIVIKRSAYRDKSLKFQMQNYRQNCSQMQMINNQSRPFGLFQSCNDSQGSKIILYKVEKKELKEKKKGWKTQIFDKGSKLNTIEQFPELQDQEEYFEYLQNNYRLGNNQQKVPIAGKIYRQFRD